MQQLYNLTNQIHEILPLVAVKYDKEICLGNSKVLFPREQDETDISECTLHSYDNYISDTGYLMTMGEQGGIATTLSHDWIVKIEEDQIREFLIVFQDVWNPPQFENMTVFVKDVYSLTKNFGASRGVEFSSSSGGIEILSYIQQLEKKWFGFRNEDGKVTPSLFDTDPVAVLTELLELLEKLNSKQ